jgi:hypothetical protein
MHYGTTAKILRVDLSTGSIEIMPIIAGSLMGWMSNLHCK